MTATLHARRAGAGEPVILLHGLFGAGGNLGALARHLLQQPAFEVISLDLPGHGRSAWLPAYSLPVLAETVAAWMQAAGVDRAHFVGHSLGGKVAMQLALAHGQHVQSLVVADIAPVAYEGRHDAVFAALRAVAGGACRSRAQAEALMAEHLVESDVIQFLLGSLRREESGLYQWRMDVAGLERDYRALLAAPDPDARWTGPVQFIKGAESDYIGEAHRKAIQSRFPGADLKVMEGCGHWLHVQKPALFNAIVSRFLARTGAGESAA